jgi:hypothetical protein
MKKIYTSYLKCNIYEGMFSNEKGVEFKDADGKYVSGFWPDDCIKNGLLEIKIFKFGKDKSLIKGPFSASSGYGFFQGYSFFVNNDLIELVEEKTNISRKVNDFKTLKGYNGKLIGKYKSKPL